VYTSESDRLDWSRRHEHENGIGGACVFYLVLRTARDQFNVMPIWKKVLIIKNADPAIRTLPSTHPFYGVAPETAKRLIAEGVVAVVQGSHIRPIGFRFNVALCGVSQYRTTVAHLQVFQLVCRGYPDTRVEDYDGN
jgi:hypothetical protein